MHLIKDEDGGEYYRIQRQFYPEYILFNALSYSAARVGLVMGTGVIISALLMTGILILLLSPLSLYFLRFIRIDNQEVDNQDNTILHKDETLLYKIVSGIFIAAGLAVFVLGIILRLSHSFEHEEINFAQPQTIVQDYDYVAEYTSDRFENTDIIDFHIKYDDINAMQSGKPSSWVITLQNTPGLLPRPNETMEFWNGKNNNINLYHYTYEVIRPTYDVALVTDSYEILAILKSENAALSDLDIKYITITPVDFSIFRIHNPEECLVEIIAGQVNLKYIVNIKDKTVRLV